MYRLIEELYPLHRSITGDGVRETLGRLARLVPLTVHEVPTGTAVFDWTIPKEWSLREAWIRGPDGETVVDLRDSSLHVVSYSVPFRARLSLEELKPHLHTLPEHPDRIPYRTTYFDEAWGFCLTHDAYAKLSAGEYEVCMDSTLVDGSLTYGEGVVPGEETEEVLVSAHCCHPSLANDNLSGIAVATALMLDLLSRERRRLTYRFLFAPATIGSIAWLARNEETVGRVRHGVVLAGVGDSGPSTYKRSRRGAAVVDRAFAHVLRHSGEPYEIVDFTPWGYDERQFCSPGFDLPVGCLMRTPHGHYSEYHTSNDNLDFVRPGALEDSLSKLLAVVDVLEGNCAYRNLSPKGEPQLGRRGLYEGSQGESGLPRRLSLLWVLNRSDGKHSLLEIADEAETPFAEIAAAATALEAAGLVEKVDVGGGGGALRES